MGRYKALIIDDEIAAQEVLQELLSRRDYNIEIMATASSLKEGVKLINSFKPDIVFLDVQMPNYNGYEITKFLDRFTFNLIFVTAYDQYAIQAFKINAIDYLLKPIDRELLDKAIAKCINRLNNQKIIDKYEIIAKAFEKEKPLRLIIPELNNRKIIDIKEIVAIQAFGAYTYIHLMSQTPFLTSKNLKYFENRLKHTNLFFRSHRSWLIQLKKIESFNRTTGELFFIHSDIVGKVTRNLYSNLENLLIQRNE